MKHVMTLNEKPLKESMKNGGCGECQTSCQSACKTSCTVGNQSCENANRESRLWTSCITDELRQKTPTVGEIVGVLLLRCEEYILKGRGSAV